MHGSKFANTLAPEPTRGSAASRPELSGFWRDARREQLASNVHGHVHRSPHSTRACTPTIHSAEHLLATQALPFPPLSFPGQTHEATVERNAYPSPLNYYNFPKSVCTSVNESICHGIPDMRELKDGDIVNVDVTAYFGGFHGDLNEVCECVCARVRARLPVVLL